MHAVAFGISVHAACAESVLTSAADEAVFRLQRCVRGVDALERGQGGALQEQSDLARRCQESHVPELVHELVQHDEEHDAELEDHVQEEQYGITRATYRPKRREEF